MRAIPHELILAMCEAAEVSADDVQAIFITPGRVVITALCRDTDGTILASGLGDDHRVATRTIELPHTPFPAPQQPQDTAAIVGVQATADAEVIRAADASAASSPEALADGEVIRAADLEAMVNGDG